MKKSDRVSEKLVSPGLPGLQVATHLKSISVSTLTGTRPDQHLRVIRVLNHYICQLNFLKIVGFILYIHKVIEIKYTLFFIKNQ